MIFIFFISFIDEIPLYKQNSPRWDAAFCGVTSGSMLYAYVPQKGRQGLCCLPMSHKRDARVYAVCLCPTKGMPGLNVLIIVEHPLRKKQNKNKLQLQPAKSD